MFFTAIIEIGNSSRAYCELAGRTEPLFADVLLAFVNLGLNTSDIDKFAQRANGVVIPTPVSSAPPMQSGILPACVKQAHPSSIPVHMLSSPDLNAFIRPPFIFHLH